MTQTLISYALTTRQKVKDYIGVSDTSLDTVIDELINGATDFIENFCGGRRFLQTLYTNEVYDSVHGRVIFLHNFPIKGDQVSGDVTAQYRSGTIMNPNWVTYDSNGYIVYGKEGYIKFYAILPEISQGLRFTYTAGYLIDFTNEFDVTKHTLPQDLTAVCTRMVAREINMRQSQGIKLQMTEGQRIEFRDPASTLEPQDLEILRHYQTIRMSI